MIQHCCVQDCKHNRRTSSCTFKRFPTDPQKSKLWESLVKRGVGSRPGAEEWKRTDWDRICECHFDDDQYEKNRQDGVKKLRWDAVPHLFGKKAKVPLHRQLGDSMPNVKESKDQGTSFTQPALEKNEHKSGDKNISPSQADMSEAVGKSSNARDESNMVMSSSEHVEDDADMTKNNCTSVEASDSTATKEQDILDKEVMETNDGENCSDVSRKSSHVIYDDSVTTPTAEETNSLKSQDSEEAQSENNSLNIPRSLDTQVDGPGARILNTDGKDTTDDVCKSVFSESESHDLNSETSHSDIKEFASDVNGSKKAEVSESREAISLGGNESRVHIMESNLQEMMEEVPEEEYGEEIEVEIEDCSDGEMGQDGGVTYIITEDMIVVEEPDSPGSFPSREPGDDVHSTEDEEQGSGSQRMKRFVIKVPASKGSDSHEETTAEIEISEVDDGLTSDSAVSKVPEETCDISIEKVHDQSSDMSSKEKHDDASELPARKVDNNTSDITIEKAYDDAPVMPMEKVYHDSSDITIEKVSDISAETPGQNTSEELSKTPTEHTPNEVSETVSSTAMEETTEVMIESIDNEATEETPVDISDDASEISVKHVTDEGQKNIENVDTLIVRDNSSENVEMHPPLMDGTIVTVNSSENVEVCTLPEDGTNTTTNSSSADIDDMLEKQMGALHAEDSESQKALVYKEVQKSHGHSIKGKEDSVNSKVQEDCTLKPIDGGQIPQPIVDSGDHLKKHLVEESEKRNPSHDPQVEIHDNIQIAKPSSKHVEKKDVLSTEKKPIDKSENVDHGIRGSKVRLIDLKHTTIPREKKERRKSVDKESKASDNLPKNEELHISKKKAAHAMGSHKVVGSRSVSKTKPQAQLNEIENVGLAETSSVLSKSTDAIASVVSDSSHGPHEKHHKHNPKKVSVAPDKKTAKPSIQTVSDKRVSPIKKVSPEKETKGEANSVRKVNADSKGTAADVTTSKKVMAEGKESKTDVAPAKKMGAESKESKPASPKKPKPAPKDVITRSSRSDKHGTSKSPSPSKTSLSVGQSPKSKLAINSESPSKDRRGHPKEARSKRQSSPPFVSPSVVSQASGKVSDSKTGLRSVRHRKQAAGEPSSNVAGTPDTPPATSKREKIKSNETPLPSRHSERVCRATEKAIASGMLSRRSRSMSGDSSAKEGEKVSDPSAKVDNRKPSSSRKGKRKGETSAPAPDTEEVPARRRRSMRTLDTNSSDVDSNPSEQVLRSGRKNKPGKRKGSPISMPIAKKNKPSSEEKIDSLFIASIPKMCRVCGCENENLLNVLGPEGKSLHLADKIHNILPIKIVEKEPLPTGVCHSCVVTLIACEKLVEKCSQIDKQLRLHFNCPVDKEPPLLSEQVPSSHPLHSSEENATQSTVLPNSLPEKNSVTPTRSKHPKDDHCIPSEQLPQESMAPTQDDLLLLLEASERMAVQPLEVKNVDSEDCPPILEAEPPPSQIYPTNQEVPAQPPVLVPQPPKPLPELMPIDDTTSPMKRFGNTYKPRVKQGQVDKIERGSELMIGESYEEPDEEPQEESMEKSDPDLPRELSQGTITTEEFHIVDLEMNVEEVPPDAEEDGQPSSPKSVVDSILVDWSGDEDDNGSDQKMKSDTIEMRNTVVTISSCSNDDVLTDMLSADSINGSAPTLRSVSSSNTPCLFVDDEDVDLLTRSKTSKSNSVVDTKCVKQESFWPEPNPSEISSVTKEKHPNDVPWKCIVCGKRGKSISKFLEHKKLHVNDRKLVSCSKCSESFSNHSLLKAHMKVHDGDDVDEETTEERLAKQGVTVRRRAVIATGPRDTIVDVDLTPDDSGLYHCSLCQNAFTNIEALCQHKLIHKQNDDAVLYRCNICRRTFFQNKDYQDHLATHQPGQKQPVGMFQCAHCDLKLTSQKEFVDHINTHTLPSTSGVSGKGFACDICQKPFESRGKLRSHRSTVHKATAYACHLCDKVCQKRITLIEHLRKHTGDNPFACPVCDKRFNRLANYKAHMMIHENARRYECPYCGKRFNRQSIQQRHIKTHTNEQPRKHRCRVCNLSFGLATEMFNHRKLHSREEVERANWEDEKQRMALTSFPCKVCQLPFTSVEDVLAHMPEHTNDERDIAVKLKNPRLVCDICGKVLNSKRTFNNHRSSHIDGKPFVCKICQKGYATSTGLNYHMLSHTGERPFPCTFCNKGYKNSTDLKVHMRQHTGEFPYKCNLCNKAFRSASSLQKHGFVHTEERPHKCQYCAMTFKRESTKINHERIHTNDRRYKCKVCSRSFIQKGACDAHEKLHFRENIPQMYGHAGGIAGIISSDSLTATTSTSNTFEAVPSEKQELFDDLEEDDFDEDDDEDDEYIIYEDDSVEDGDEEEMDVDSDSQHKDNVRDPLKGNAGGAQKSFGESSKSSNGVNMPCTSITPVPVSVANDTVPSAGDDSSVHITIL